MGIYLCFRIKKLKFLSSTFCRRKGGANRRCGARAEGACTLCRAARRKRRECGLKPRGDKFSGSQLAVGKMVACALLRVKRSPFLNPPSALRPLSENSSAAFLLSPTEYTLWRIFISSQALACIFGGIALCATAPASKDNTLFQALCLKLYNKRDF